VDSVPKTIWLKERGGEGKGGKYVRKGKDRKQEAIFWLDSGMILPQGSN